MKHGLLIGIIAMSVVVISSNVLVQFILGEWLTFGALTYPFAFLVNDLTNRLLGPGPAKKVVIYGFIIGLICSLVGSQIIGENGPLVTLRIAIGSGLAFLIAQLVDIFVFNKLRTVDWWQAPLTSTFFGSAIDTAIFFTIAFSTSLTFIDPSVDVSWASEIKPVLGLGNELPYWVSLGLADFMVKIGLSLIALVPFWLVVRDK